MAIAENSSGLAGAVLPVGSGGLRLARARGQSSAHWAEVNTVKAVFRRHPWLLYAVLLILAAYVFLDMIARPGAPMEVLQAVAEKSIVPLGEPVRAAYYFDRRRNCPGTVEGVWTDADGKELAKMLAKPTTSTALGKHWISVALPPVPGTGPRCYNSTIRYFCGDDSYVVESPMVCVAVVPAP